MKALTDNVAGHRAKYDHLRANLPQEEVGPTFVGGGDATWTGFNQVEILRSLKDLDGAAVVDIGCGIGRTTRYLLDENVSTYLGIDVIPEILQGASDLARGRSNFVFVIGADCALPCPDASADIICAFSVITHLLDEEIFDYFLEMRRVIRPNGVAVVSFLDFESPEHRAHFRAHAAHHRQGHGDLTRFTTKAMLQLLALEAGFSATKFIDYGAVDVAPTGRVTLIDGRAAPRTTKLGQSCCIMTV